MSRSSIKKKKLTQPDPIYESALIQKILNHLMREGKKNSAQKILKQTFQIIERKAQQDPIALIEQAIVNTAPAVEIKARRIGGAVYSIPIELNSERGISTAIRWIINCCKTKSNKPFAYKLSNEFLEASAKTGSAVRKKDEIHKMAESNARLL